MGTAISDADLQDWVDDCRLGTSADPRLEDAFLRLALRCLKAEAERAEARALVAAPYQVYFREEALRR